jgi:hypothetical protein
MGLSHRDDDEFSLFDFLEISRTGEKLLSTLSPYVGELSESLDRSSVALAECLRPWFSKINETEVGNDLVKDFCFTTLKLALMGRPANAIKQMTMFSFPHYNTSAGEDGAGSLERSLSCFFLYSTELISDEGERRLREGLSYVSLMVAGAEYARLVQREILKGGTRAAGTALIVGSINHNIGSHGIHWFEHEARELALRYKANNSELGHYFEDKARFFAYLRERLEFVATVAIYSPAWMTTSRFGELVRELSDNGSFLGNLARSEGVAKVHFPSDQDWSEEVAVPGGPLGRQALYTILENIIRDGAKYGRASTSDASELEVSIELSQLESRDFDRSAYEDLSAETEEEIKENLVRITICDNKSTYEKSKDEILKVFEALRSEGICDERGKLLSGGRGVKERFICAAFLRGESLTELLAGDRKPEVPIIKIEKIHHQEDRLGWTFYMLKPKEVLLVSDRFRQGEVPKDLRERTNVWDWMKFRGRVNSPYSRHTFVILDLSSPRDVSWLLSPASGVNNICRLPYRLVLGGDKKLIHETIEQLNRPMCQIEDGLMQPDRLSTAELYPHWLSFVLMRPWKEDHSEVLNNPGIVVSSGKWSSAESGTRASVGNYVLLRHKPPQNIAYEANKYIVFDDHADGKNEFFPNNERGNHVLTYEPHEADHSVRNWAAASTVRDIIARHEDHVLYRFIEAASLRVLIVDERLDPSLDALRIHFSGSQKGGVEIPLRSLLQAKAITVRGQEYAGQSDRVVAEGEMIEWVKESPFDFALIHQGILDKLFREQKKHNNKSRYIQSVCEQMRISGKLYDVIIHSGRTLPDLPPSLKFLSLTSIEKWLNEYLAKVELTDELLSLRRS